MHRHQPRQKRDDPADQHVIGGHSYDRGTIQWAAESDGWGKLQGPLRDDEAAQAAAVEWAG